MKSIITKIFIISYFVLFALSESIAQNLTSGLVSVWEFDETSGTTAYDSHGNNDLLIHGGASINQSGVIGTSFTFDGINDYLQTASNDLCPVENHSISAWIKRNGDGTSLSSSIMAKYWSLVGYRCYWFALISRDYDSYPNALYFNYWDSSNLETPVYYSPETDIWTGHWRHVVVTRSGADIKLYVDGNLVVSATGGNGMMQEQTQTVKNCIGAVSKSNTIPDKFANFTFDQVGVWNKALTATEISLLYNSGNGLPYSEWENPTSPLSGGEISPDSLTINTGESPETISSVSDASGGNGTYTYQWQLSTDGSTFSDISGATGTSYTAPVLTQNIWYRRKVTDGASAEAYSNVSVIEVITSGGECLWNENAGYIYRNGKVSINTISAPGDYALAVNGKIRAKEIKVDTDWADYVFDTDYRLKTLEEIESFIKENKHLPEIPTAQDVEKGGVDLGEMNMLLLKKVEELTLYIIELKKENAQVKLLEQRIEKLEQK